MNCKKLLYLVTVLGMMLIPVLSTPVQSDDPAPPARPAGGPVVRQSTWGAIKALYRGSRDSTQTALPFGVQKPGTEIFSSSRFTWGYCTWYAATEFDKVASWPDCNWGGDAARWWNNAASMMWYKDGHYYRWICPNASPLSAAYWNIPNGSIVVWDNGGTGHVAVVRSWFQNGINIQEMNWVGFGKVSSTTLFWSQVWNRNGYRFVGYITPRQVMSW